MESSIVEKEQFKMKCIYCNSSEELTSSDIISYGVTGAKLTKKFVCKKHNALTNDKYEKKFIEKLNFFRNGLGMLTREGKQIQFNANLIVDGMVIQGVKVSDRKSIYDPKGIIAGTSSDGKKVLIAPIEKLRKIKGSKIENINLHNLTVQSTNSADDFAGYHAIHSVAKIAYEWYCYIHGIEEYLFKYENIVNYILGKNEENIVEIVFDQDYYSAIDHISEIGTNSILEYNDIDGNKYVVFSLWNMIAYRVKIGQTDVIEEKPHTRQADIIEEEKLQNFIFDIYMYHLDGSKNKTTFCAYPYNGDRVHFVSFRPEQVTEDMWSFFVHRSEKLLKTKVLTIKTMKKNVDLFESDLELYRQGKLDFAHLLRFEENEIVSVIEAIANLHHYHDFYDKTKSFNENLAICFKTDNDIVIKNQEGKVELLTEWDKMNKSGEFYNNAKMWIDSFNEIYNWEMERIN